MMPRTFIHLLALPLLAVGFVACVAEPGDSDPSDATEEVDEASLALGEVGCETVTADDSLSQPSLGGQTFSSYSTSATYDHGSSCPNQWVAEFSPESGSDFNPSVSWADAAITSSGTCQNSRLELGIYRKNGGVWDSPKTETYAGTWSNGACTFTRTSPTEWSVNAGDVVRLAGAAYTLTPFFFNGSTIWIKSYRKVSVSLQAFY